MRNRVIYVITLGVSLVGLLPSQAYAGEAPMEKRPVAVKATTAERLGGLVGTIAAISPESRTVVIDVPLAKDVLRLGAVVTQKTEILMAGAPASFQDLEKGARVRIDFRRVPSGDEAIAVEILERLER